MAEHVENQALSRINGSKPWVWDMASVEVSSGQTGFGNLVSNTNFEALNMNLNVPLEGVVLLDGNKNFAEYQVNEFRRINSNGTLSFRNQQEYDAFVEYENRTLRATFSNTSSNQVLGNPDSAHFPTLQIDIPQFKFLSWSTPVGGPNRLQTSFTAKGERDIDSSYMTIGPTVSWRTGWQFTISDRNDRGFALGIASSRVELSNDLGPPNSSNELIHSIPSVFMDTTDDFHVYKLVISGGIATLFVDSIEVGSLGTGSANSFFANLLHFGDATAYGDSETDLRYIKTNLTHQQIDESDIDLFIRGSIDQELDNISLFVVGIVPPPTLIYSTSKLYTKVSELESDNMSLVILGVVLPPVEISGGLNLMTKGVAALPAQPPVQGRFVDTFLKMAGYTPDLVGKFIQTNPTSVIIEIWDITNGDNVALVLISDIVTQIGDTESWRWSMANMPTDRRADGNFFFRMTADTGEELEREIMVTTVAKGRLRR